MSLYCFETATMTRRVSSLMILAAAFGCSDTPRRAAVEGTIRVAGKPLERGIIHLYPVEGTLGPSAGARIQAGTYKLTADQGAVVGRSKIEIRGFRKTGKSIRDEWGKPAEEEAQVVPTEYNAHSKVVKTITPGNNILDFDLPAIR